MATTAHAATAYPTEHLYRTSPEDTETALHQAIDELAANYQRSSRASDYYYRQRAGVAGPNPKEGAEPSGASSAPEPPASTEGQQAPPPLGTPAA